MKSRRFHSPVGSGSSERIHKLVSSVAMLGAALDGRVYESTHVPNTFHSSFTVDEDAFRWCRGG